MKISRGAVQKITGVTVGRKAPKSEKTTAPGKSRFSILRLSRVEKTLALTHNLGLPYLTALEKPPCAPWRRIRMRRLVIHGLRSQPLAVLGPLSALVEMLKAGGPEKMKIWPGYRKITGSELRHLCLLGPQVPLAVCCWLEKAWLRLEIYGLLRSTPVSLHETESFNASWNTGPKPRWATYGLGNTLEDYSLSALHREVIARLDAGQWLRLLRDAWGLSPEGLAARIGVSEALLIGWESGGIIHDAHWQGVLAAFFGIPLGWMASRLVR